MKRPTTTLEPIGLVLLREAGLRPPPTVETAPIAPRDWEAAVGTRIAARAQPLRLDRGLLTVRTASSTWAQELSLLSEPILAQLRARGVPVTGLRFRVGHVAAPERPPLRDEVRTTPPEAPLPPEVVALLAHIADPELRDAIAHAAARNLGWQLTLKAAPKKKPRRAPRPAAPPAAEVAPPRAPTRLPVRAPAPPAPPSAAPERGAPARTATSAPSAARGPRSAAPGSARPDRAPPPSPGGSRGKS
jgi:hypothetical protein